MADALAFAAFCVTVAACVCAVIWAIDRHAEREHEETLARLGWYSCRPRATPRQEEGQP
jgi:hypothetical protein